MTEPVQVRGARPGDTEALLRLWTGLVTYHQTLERVRPSRCSGPVEETLRPLLAQGATVTRTHGAGGADPAREWGAREFRDAQGASEAPNLFRSWAMSA